MATDNRYPDEESEQDREQERERSTDSSPDPQADGNEAISPDRGRATVVEDDTLPDRGWSASDGSIGDDSVEAPSTEPPYSIAFGGDVQVDRDDDVPTDRDAGAPQPRFVDSDYNDDYPGAAGGDGAPGEEPDPGYAAFADEFDDPLADWPAPDADLRSLPEMRDRSDRDASAAGYTTWPDNAADGAGDGARDGAADTTAGYGPGYGADPDSSYRVEPQDDVPLSDHGEPGRPAEGQDGEVDEGFDDLPEAAFFDDPAERETVDDNSMKPGKPARVDTDDLVPVTSGLVPATPGVESDHPVPLATVEDPEAPQGASGEGSATKGDGGDMRPARNTPSSGATQVTGAYDIQDIQDIEDIEDIEDIGEDAYGPVDHLHDVEPDRNAADVAPRAAASDQHSDDEADDEGFLDDFLNDLDGPADDATEVRRPGTAADDTLLDADDGRGGARSMPPVDSAARFGIADKLDADESRSGGESVLSDGPAAPTAADVDGGSGIPWSMIAVVAVALLLLGAGGYGVIQQRSSLKSEIRDLQAQLATAVKPEDVVAARERQRELALENASLNAELTRLQTDNGSLEGRLSSLEAELESLREAAEREATEQASQQQAAAAAPEPTRETTPARPEADDSAASGWFVNFGSYAQADIARRWADRLDVDSGRVVVQEARASGRTLYRVRVVGLSTQDLAERVATTLEREHQLPRLWVGRN